MIGNLRLAEYALPPLAYARVIRSWVGYEARAPDILPLAGEIPGFENAYVLGAVLGGYTIGPYIGRLLGDAILGKEQESGSIVNVSSLMGLRGYPMRSAYSATKFALIGMTEAFAHEVGRFGVRVNALCPGAVQGELMERVIARRAEAEERTPETIIKLKRTTPTKPRYGNG